MDKRYTILLCKYTGKVGLVRKDQMGKPKILACTNRDPIIYTPMVIKETITLGWVLAGNITTAWAKTPVTFKRLNTDYKEE